MQNITERLEVDITFALPLDELDEFLVAYAEGYLKDRFPNSADRRGLTLQLEASKKSFREIAPGYASIRLLFTKPIGEPQ